MSYTLDWTNTTSVTRSGTTTIYGASIDYDNANNIYVTYQVGPNTIFDSGDYYVHVVKFNSSGVQQWKKTQSSPDASFNATTKSHVPCLKYDRINNYLYLVYATDSATGPWNETSQGLKDIVFVKINPSDGGTLWVKRNSDFNTNQDEQTPTSLGMSLAIDASGCPVCAYYMFGSLDISESGVNPAQWNWAIAKLNPDGSTNFAKTFRGYGFGGPFVYFLTGPSVDVDSNRNIYVSVIAPERITGSDIPANGQVKTILTKIDPTGTILVQTQNQNFNPTGDSPDPPQIKLDGLGNLYLLGSCATNFYGPLNSQGGYDTYLVKMSASDLSTVAWAKMDSDFNDGNNQIRGNIAFDTNQNPVIANGFANSSNDYRIKVHVCDKRDVSGGALIYSFDSNSTAVLNSNQVPGTGNIVSLTYAGDNNIYAMSGYYGSSNNDLDGVVFRLLGTGGGGGGGGRTGKGFWVANNSSIKTSSIFSIKSTS
jgi:hypothetical protein